jgi:hypothetical protein
MQNPFRKLAGFRSPGIATPTASVQRQDCDYQDALLSEQRWEAALMASSYDENARMYLDHFGSCRR